MTKWTTADLPNLAGRTAVVTGATGGIGLIAARELAKAGAHVVLAVRDVARGSVAAASIAGSTEVRELDVSSLASVRSFAQGWTGDLDILINNAGIMQVPFAVTADGLESQAATNYFGPFLLTNLLLPHITDRIVSVSSQLHRLGHVNVETLGSTNGKYNDFAAYTDSKLAITLFSLELQRRLDAAGSGVRSIIAHPGIARTNLTAHRGAGVNRLGILLNDPETGALPLLFAAVEDIPGNSYVGPRGPGSVKGHPVVRHPSKTATDPQLAAALWNRTAEIVQL